MASAHDNVHPYLDVEANITIHGIELRTWIAARMMAANRMSLSVNSTSEYIAQRAVADTDALIKELNK